MVRAVTSPKSAPSAPTPYARYGWDARTAILVAGGRSRSVTGGGCSATSVAVAVTGGLSPTVAVTV